MRKVPSTRQGLLNAVTARAGGVPDFAKDALKNVGMTNAEIDEAECARQHGHAEGQTCHASGQRRS